MRPMAPHRLAALSDARQQPGFTLLELIVVIIIVSILGVVLLDRFWRYQEQAEKVAMEQFVGTIKSALSIQVSGLITKGGIETVPDLIKENPISWLAEKPENYLGEYFSPKVEEIPPGNWYFDLKDRELVYIPKRVQNFVPAKVGRKWVRYKLELVYNLPRRGATAPELGGVVLALTTPYKWF